VPDEVLDLALADLARVQRPIVLGEPLAELAATVS
jgi:hypothetical protein